LGGWILWSIRYYRVSILFLGTSKDCVGHGSDVVFSEYPRLIEALRGFKVKAVAAKFRHSAAILIVLFLSSFFLHSHSQLTLQLYPTYNLAFSSFQFFPLYRTVLIFGVIIRIIKSRNHLNMRFGNHSAHCYLKSHQITIFVNQRSFLIIILHLFSPNHQLFWERERSRRHFQKKERQL
jgi:hypothetical protein